MRGGRLNDGSIVLPRGLERIPQASDFFTEGALCFGARVEGERGITKATSPCGIGPGKGSFWWRSVARGRLGKKYATRSPPPNKLCRAAHRPGVLHSEELRSWAHALTEWARCNAQFGPIFRSGEARAGCSGRGLGASDRGRANVREPRRGELRSSPGPMSEDFSSSCDVASRNPLIHNGATNAT
jgi:hypothetical protein